jgi:hypothetical protein
MGLPTNNKKTLHYLVIIVKAITLHQNLLPNQQATPKLLEPLKNLLKLVEQEVVNELNFMVGEDTNL